MPTVIGIIIGIIATAVVAHYYFRRSVNKSLAVYLTLNSRIFAGIDPSVREQLKFHFRDAEVRDLYQIELIIANDGERAIRDCIEPLSVKLPSGVEILDASVLHRNPQELVINVKQAISPTGNAVLKFEFPLLNKRDFFLVKLLLNGNFDPFDLQFHILVDDLPRTLKPKRLPREATRESGPRVEWAGVVFGGLMLIVALAQGYGMYSLCKLTPQYLPIPWNSFKPNPLMIAVLLLWGLGTFMMFLLGVLLFFGMGFEDFFKRHPRFPLPSELRRHGAFIIPELVGDIDAAKKQVELLDEAVAIKKEQVELLGDAMAKKNTKMPG